MTAFSNALDGLQERILHGEGAIAARVRGADATQRLRIYADAWHLRLVDVLGNDFPATRDAIGDDGFAALAGRYLQAHPSTQPSVRHVGSGFADWLEMHAEAPRGLHEVARFEWLQAAAFDAVDARALGIEDVAALPTEGWPALRLTMQPCVGLLDTTRLAIADRAPTPGQCDVPARWLFWRDIDGDVQWRQLEEDEADALRAIAHGADFGELCERLTTHGDDGAPRAASLLKRWLVDGLLVAPNVPD